MTLTAWASVGAIRTHVERLAEYGPRHATNPDSVTASLVYLSSCLSDYGYRVRREPYGAAPHEVNLLCEPPDKEFAGKSVSRSVLEIAAHWDTVDASPGADDNASGVAGVLELARMFALDPPPARVRFCLFGGEEDRPPFTGSAAHVANLASDPVPVTGVLVLEMIAYRDTRPGSQRFPPTMIEDYPALSGFDRGDFIAAVANPRAADYLSALQRAAVPARASASARASAPLPMLPMPVPDGHTGAGARSDHYPYWRSGRKGVMLTDTAEFRNPHYHQPTDLPGTLDFGFAAQTTDLVADAVRLLGA